MERREPGARPQRHLDHGRRGLDLVGEITGGGRFEDLLPHSVELRVFDRPLRCLSLPKLIAVQRAAGRPKDLEAIAELEALRDEGEREG